MYAPNNYDTAETISKILGNQTVIFENTSTSVSKGTTTTSKSIQAQSRPLMSADAVMTLEGPVKDSDGKITKPGQMLVKVAGFPAILGRQILYFRDPAFSARAEYASDHIPQSNILMEDLRRTYKRPKYDWTSDEEWKAQQEEDKDISDNATLPKSLRVSEPIPEGAIPEGASEKPAAPTPDDSGLLSLSDFDMFKPWASDEEPPQCAEEQKEQPEAAEPAAPVKLSKAGFVNEMSLDETRKKLDMNKNTNAGDDDEESENEDGESPAETDTTEDEEGEMITLEVSEDVEDEYDQ